MTGAILLLALSSAVHAGATIYRCGVGGKTLFSDTPCGSPEGVDGCSPTPKPAPQTVGNPGVASALLSGHWRGHVEYFAVNKGQRVRPPVADGVLILDVGPDGKVEDRSEETGCKWLGRATSIGMPGRASLELSLSACVTPDLNQRFSGDLVVEAKSNEGLLRLSASDAQSSAAASYEVWADVR